MPGRPEPRLQRNAPLALQPSSAIIVPEHRLRPESAHVPTSRRGRPSWIYAITRNRCLTALQKRRSLDSLDELGEESGPGWEVAGEACGDRAAQLRGLVELLPERLRRALVLYYYEERSVSEVPLMLGCPEGTVKTTLFRARAALAQMLKHRKLDDLACWQEDTP